MALNLNNGGEFTPHIRYMASTSSWSMSSENGMQPFQFTQAIFDFENIKTGWCKIMEATAPEWVLDPSLTQMAQKPEGDNWKRGFKVDLFSKSMFGDANPVREFATSGTGAVMGINNVYEQYEAEKSANAGKVPVVEFQGGVPTKVGKGNTSVPTLVITKWAERPAELQGQAATAQSQPVQQEAPQAQDAPVQQAASGGASEF